jgi:hypothetical protein
MYDCFHGLNHPDKSLETCVSWIDKGVGRPTPTRLWFDCSAETAKTLSAETNERLIRFDA